MRKDKIFYLFIAIVATIAGFSDQISPADEQQLLMNEEVAAANSSSFTFMTSKKQTTTESEMPAAYNAPSRIDVRGAWDFNLNVSFLYRYAREKGLELAGRLSRLVLPDGSTSYTDDIIQMDYGYHPAFKIGVGMYFNRDDWDFNFYYTRLHSTDKKRTSVDLGIVWDPNNWTFLEPIWSLYFPLLVPVGRTYDSYAKWKLETDIFDFELGRFFYVGKKLTLRPHIGMKAGIIDQNYYNENLATPDAVTSFMYFIKNKSDSWLIGPRGGIDTKWCFGKGFRLFGNALASLFYQRIKTNIHQEVPFQDNHNYIEDYSAKDKSRFVNTYLEGILGFGWGDYLANNKLFLDISLGYDFSIYFNQNMIRSFWNSIQTVGFPPSFHAHDDGNPNNLMFHGLNVKAQFDF